MTLETRNKVKPFPWYRKLGWRVQQASFYAEPLSQRRISGVDHASTTLRVLIDKRVFSVPGKKEKPDRMVLIRKHDLAQIFFIPELFCKILDYLLPSFVQLHALATALDSLARVYLGCKWGEEVRIIPVISSKPNRVGDKYDWPTGCWFWSCHFKIVICDYLRLLYLSKAGRSKVNFEEIKTRPEWISDSHFYQERFPPCIMSAKGRYHHSATQVWSASPSKCIPGCELMCQRMGEISSCDMLEMSHIGFMEVPEAMRWLFLKTAYLHWPESDLPELDRWEYWEPKQFQYPDLLMDKNAYTRCRECYKYLPHNQRLQDTALLEYTYSEATSPGFKDKLAWANSLGRTNNNACVRQSGPLCWDCLCDRVEICTVAEAYGRIVKLLNEDLLFEAIRTHPLYPTAYGIAADDFPFNWDVNWDCEPFAHPPLLGDPMEGSGFSLDDSHSDRFRRNRIAQEFRTAWSLLSEVKRRDKEDTYGIDLSSRTPKEMGELLGSAIPELTDTQEVAIQQQGWCSLYDLHDMDSWSYAEALGVTMDTLTWSLRLLTLLPFKRMLVPHITYETNTVQGRRTGSMGLGSISWTKLAWFTHIPADYDPSPGNSFENVCYPSFRGRSDPNNLFPLQWTSPFMYGYTPCTRKQLMKLAKHRADYKRECSTTRPGIFSAKGEDGKGYVGSACFDENGDLVLHKYEQMIGRKDHCHHLEELSGTFDEAWKVDDRGERLQAEIRMSMLEGPYSDRALPIMFRKDVDKMIKVLRKNLHKRGATETVDKIFMTFYGGGNSKKYSDVQHFIINGGVENSLIKSPFDHHRLAAACIGVTGGKSTQHTDYLTSPRDLPTGQFVGGARGPGPSIMHLSHLASSDVTLISEFKEDPTFIFARSRGLKGFGEAGLLVPVGARSPGTAQNIPDWKESGQFDKRKNKAGDYNVVYPYRGKYFIYPDIKTHWHFELPDRCPQPVSEYYLEYKAINRFEKIDPDYQIQMGYKKASDFPPAHCMTSHVRRRQALQKEKEEKLKEEVQFDLAGNMIEISDEEPKGKKRKGRKDRSKKEKKKPKTEVRQLTIDLTAEEDLSDFKVSEIKAGGAKELVRKLRRKLEKKAQKYMGREF